MQILIMTIKTLGKNGINLFKFSLIEQNFVRNLI
jgi:hypothetical protein